LDIVLISFDSDLVESETSATFYNYDGIFGVLFVLLTAFDFMAITA